MKQISNAEFLKIIFGDDWPNVHVAGFPGDPNKPPHPGVWAGARYGNSGAMQLTATNNNYYCVSIMEMPLGGGKAKRQTHLAKSLNVLVMDDVGTKVDKNKLKAALGGTSPSFVVETSQGNYQFGYLLETPYTPLSLAALVEKAWDDLACSLTDDNKNPGSGDLTRYMRFPNGINGKEKYKDDNDNPFACRMVGMDENRRNDPKVLALTLGVDPADYARAAAGETVVPVKQPPDGITDLQDDDTGFGQALEKRGLIRGTIKDGAWDIECPFIDEHTNRADSGCAYLGDGNFKCHHGHCLDRKQKEYAERLEELHPGFEAETEKARQEIARKTFDALDPDDIRTTDLQRAADIARGLPKIAKHKKSTTGEMRVADTYATILRLLKDHPDWDGVIKRDTFRNKVYRLKPIPGYDPATEARLPAPDKHAPGELKPGDYGTIRCWFEHVIDPHGKFAALDRAIEDHAGLSTFDSLVDMWDGLPDWDGTKRVDDWLFTYCNAKLKAGDPTHKKLIQRFGSKWLIAGAARAYEPACQCDYVLILHGLQGSRKTSLFRALAGDKDWHADDVPHDLSNKDARQHLDGLMIAEFGEIPQAKREVEVLKQFITARKDRYRPPYGRVMIDVPRRVLLAASTNSDDFLQDTSGGRRFWPVDNGVIELERFIKDRDQLLAEARHRYKAGEKWFIDDARLNAAAQSLAREYAPKHDWQRELHEYLLTGEGSHLTEVHPGDLYNWLTTRGANNAYPNKMNMSGRIAKWLKGDINWHRETGRERNPNAPYMRPVDWSVGEAPASKEDDTQAAQDTMSGFFDVDEPEKAVH